MGRVEAEKKTWGREEEFALPRKKKERDLSLSLLLYFRFSTRLCFLKKTTTFFYVPCEPLHLLVSPIQSEQVPFPDLVICLQKNKIKKKKRKKNLLASHVCKIHFSFF